MATRKQQKRKQKARVHGYVRDTPQQAERTPKEPRPSRRPSRRPAQSSSRSGWFRTPAEPSLQRSLRRSGTLVLPALLLLWYFLSKPDQRTFATFATAVALPVLVFIPFDYYATRFMNNMVKRKTGGR